MSMENPAEEILVATEKKDENESQKSMSDGEIVDDDEDVEDAKPAPVASPLKKLQKNFRARHSDSDDGEEEEEGAIAERKTDKGADGAKKLTARIVNGDEKYLQSVRKKIISELNEKNDAKRGERHNSDRRSGNFHQNRFNNHRRDNRFRPPSPPHHLNDSFRRNHSNARAPAHDRRENGKRDIPSDMLEVRGRFRILHFPKSIVKHTKTTPSVSYAENPHLKNDKARRERKRRSSRGRVEKSAKEKNSKEKRRSRSTRRSQTPKVQRAKVKNDTPKQPEKEKEKEPEKSSTPAHEETKAEEKADPDQPLNEPEKHDEQEEKKEDEQQEGEEEIKAEENNEEAEEVQQEEKMKFEPIIIERKTIRKIERPKVNIFLEDSDEVDEFENANVITTLEVKSKWSSPEPEPAPIEEDNDSNTVEFVPKSPESRFKETLLGVPKVDDSPEKSPPLTPMTDSIFESSSTSMSVSKSPTPMATGKPVKNVCSFLSDIESEGYLSGLSLDCGLYSDDDEDDSKLTDNLEPVAFLNSGSLFSLSCPEPDTTFDKASDEKEKKDNGDNDSDSDESENSSSSESSSDSSSSSSSESEDESSDSSDDETTALVSRFVGGGFGRFDATSIPMVTQIKPVLTQTIAGASTEPTVVQSRFQPHQSIIRPPGLLTTLTRTPLYAPTQVIATPTTPMPFATPFGTGQFPVPFKIYSLKDAGNSGIIFPSAPVAPTFAIPAPVPAVKEKEREREKERDRERERDKRPEKRERERDRHRSHSRERDRDRKRHKDDRRESERRKTPPSRRRSHSPKKKRSPTPKRKSPSPAKRKHTDDKRDAKRREPSPRHGSSHSSRSRHSPVRRSRRSRSRSPARSSTNSRARTPPSRPRTPPLKVRRVSPPRRSHSRSPPSKFRRSSSPSHRNHQKNRSSPSPIYRRSPRRRFSPSPIKDQNHSRRTPSRSPDYDRYDRRSYSPSFRGGKGESPNGYKPDSTISDTELERQQQFSAAQGDFYAWNSSMPAHSPRRQNLDERINRMLSESPTPAGTPQQIYTVTPDNGAAFPYPPIHDNQHGYGYYPDSYPPPASAHYSDGFPSPRYVNNANLVDLSQQKSTRQRNQVAVQVGNCLEIVPSTRMPTPPPKSLSPEEIRQLSERREQAKLRRKSERERKRMAKFVRKEKLRQEIQKYFDAGIGIEDSDDEALIRLRPVNVNAVAERGIIKKKEEQPVDFDAVVGEKREKRVLFTDGVHAGETSSDGENNADSEHTKRLRLKRKRIRKKRLSLLVRERKNASAGGELELLVQKQDAVIDSVPPDPPPCSPPPHMKQPQLKVITADMFAAFAVNHEPMYYHLHKLQAQQESAAAAAAAAANSYHTPARNNSDRYRYSKHQPPPQQSPYMQQQRYCIPPKPLNSLDPRINQQRTVEKSFA